MGFLSNLTGGKDRKAARNAAANAALQGFNFTGPGGMSVGFTPTSGNVALGALDPIRAMLLQSVGGSLGRDNGLGALFGAGDAASGSLGAGAIDPSMIGTLLSRALGQTGTGAAPNFGATGLPANIVAMLSGAVGGQAGSGALPSSLMAALSGVKGAGRLDPSLLSGLSSAALSRLGTAGANPDAIAAERLGLLRQQAQPYEQDFIQKSIGDLFSRGRFGSNDSLSGKVSEGVTRALSGADIQRQMEAADFGRQTQADAVSQALGLTQGAQGLMGDEFSRALSAFGAEANVAELGQAGQNAETARLGQLVSLLSGNIGDTFSRNLAGFEAGQSGANSEVARMLQLLTGAQGVSEQTDNRAIQRFNIAQQLFDSNLAGTASNTQNALGALGGVNAIDQSGLNQFMAALQSAVARSNSYTGQSQLYSGLAQQTPLLDLAGGALSAMSFGPFRKKP